MVDRVYDFIPHRDESKRPAYFVFPKLYPLEFSCLIRGAGHCKLSFKLEYNLRTGRIYPIHKYSGYGVLNLRSNAYTN